jgi:hypothetical protein
VKPVSARAVTSVRRLRGGVLLVAATAGLGFAAPTSTDPAPAPLVPTLARQLQADGFTQADLAAIAGGRAVARSLPRADRDEAGAIGVVRINLPPDVFLGRLRDIVRFERGSGVTAVGRFGVPARASDLDGYELPAEDLRDLPHCELDDCDVNLSETAIRRFRAVDSRAPDAKARFGRTAREALADYVADYQRRGNEALAVYRDREPPFALREASARLLRQAAELRQTAPALAAYLERYPAAPLPPGGEEFFYWSVMSFGMKPITRANHVVVVPIETDGLPGFVAASRTLYASHYFRDGLEVKYVVPVSAERTAFYLVSVNRSHSESLTGMKGLLLGGRIRSSARSGVERHVLYVKRQAERAAP